MRAPQRRCENLLHRPLLHVFFSRSQFSAAYSSPPNVSSARWVLRLVWAGVRRLSRGRTAAPVKATEGQCSQRLILVVRNRRREGRNKIESRASPTCDALSRGPYMKNAPGLALDAIEAASCHGTMSLRSLISAVSDGLGIPASRWRDAPPGS